MSFPQTHKTLIFRLASRGSQRDWRRFLNDYWLPVCTFAQQRAELKIEDAEDVAAETFEVVLRNRLLESWYTNRSSKLRTLLCTVVRHILANRARIQKGRMRLLRRTVKELVARRELPTIKAKGQYTEDADRFYNAWVVSILFGCAESLMQEYKREGRTDCLRVLHLRVYGGLKTTQVSKSLGLKPADVRKFYNSACGELRIKLRHLLQEHVCRYCAPEDVADELDSEWNRIGHFLKDHGGLGRAIATVCEQAGLVEMADRQSKVVSSTLKRMTDSRTKT